MSFAIRKWVPDVIGRPWGQCCELRRLWVDPAHRRLGAGTRLVRRFEEAAAARGCSVFYLDTFSFQARPFYERLGYEARLEIRGFAPGVAKYIMVRRDSPEGPCNEARACATT